MVNAVDVTVYRGVDYDGVLAERVVKVAAVILARSYGIPVNVNVVEIPADGEESKMKGLPLVIIDGSVVAEGRVPSVEEIVDSVFDRLKVKTRLYYGFPVIDEALLEAEA